MIRLDIMGVHGQGAGEGVEGLYAGKVAPQLGVGLVEDIWKQPQLRSRGPEVGEHEVADAEDGEAGDDGGAPFWAQDEQEHLADVVVALEVAEVRVAAEDFGDEGGELCLALAQFGIGLV